MKPPKHDPISGNPWHYEEGEGFGYYHPGVALYGCSVCTRMPRDWWRWEFNLPISSFGHTLYEVQAIARTQIERYMAKRLAYQAAPLMRPYTELAAEMAKALNLPPSVEFRIDKVEGPNREITGTVIVRDPVLIALLGEDEP